MTKRSTNLERTTQKTKCNVFIVVFLTFTFGVKILQVTRGC